MVLTEKYTAWLKYHEKYTAKQVIVEILSDLEYIQDNIITNKVNCRLHTKRTNCRDYKLNKNICFTCTHNINK